MTSSTGRPNSPPLALTSSRQMSSAVLITLLGAAPAPVSARLKPILIGIAALRGRARERQQSNDERRDERAQRIPTQLRHRFLP